MYALWICFGVLVLRTLVDVTRYLHSSTCVCCGRRNKPEFRWCPDCGSSTR